MFSSITGVIASRSKPTGTQFPVQLSGTTNTAVSTSPVAFPVLMRSTENTAVATNPVAFPVAMQSTENTAVGKNAVTFTPLLGGITPQPAPVPVTEEAIDPNWDYVSLLMKGEGVDAGTVFTDSSIRTKTPTVVNSVITSTTRAKFGSASIYSNAVGHLTIPVNTDFTFGSGDFTMECWFFTSATNQQGLVSNRLSGPRGWALTTSAMRAYINGAWSDTQITWTAPSINTWHHIAMVRYGGTITVYLNGTSVGTKSISGGWDDTYSTSLAIGNSISTTAAEQRFDGHLDDIRITKGVARYIANFTPPAETFPTQGDAYFDSVSLLAHAEGTHGSTTFVDSSSNAFATSATNGTTITTADSKFGGASLVAPSNATLDVKWLSKSQFLMTGDFTLECWVKVPSRTTHYFFYLSETEAAGRVTFFSNSSGQMCMNRHGSSNLLFSNSATVYPVDTWFHLAVTRASGQVRCFVNGGMLGTVISDAGTMGNGAGGFHLGAAANSKFDEVRVTKGVARYIESFTPPTKPYADAPVDPMYSSVQLLVPGDDKGTAVIADKSSFARTVTVTNATSSTAQSKFGGASISFDGTTDYLTIGTGSDWKFMHDSTAKWTWESWVKINSFTNSNTLFSTSDGSTGNSGVYCAILNSRAINIQIYRANTGTFVVEGSFSGLYPNDLTNWHHIAVVFDVTTGSNNAVLYIDGIQSGTLNKTTHTPSGLVATRPLRIGTYGFAGADFNGYMDDIRLTQNVRYSSNFIPRMAALPIK